MFDTEANKYELQEFSQITNQRSHSFGIKSILSRYKSNSQIVKISNYFAQNSNSYDHLIGNQIRYLGNTSDLWSMLQFQIKAIGPLLKSNSMDINLTKKLCEFGQIFMLYLTQTKISNLKIKLEIEGFYLQKIAKFRELLLKERIHNNQNYKDRNLNNEQISIWLISQHYDQSNEENITKYLKKLLRSIIYCLKIGENEKQKQNNKSKRIICLICMSLLFVLKYPIWEKVCFSNFFITHCLIKHLIQTNGAMIIGNFLYDASSHILDAEIEKLEKELFKH